MESMFQTQCANDCFLLVGWLRIFTLASLNSSGVEVDNHIALFAGARVLSTPMGLGIGSVALSVATWKNHVHEGRQDSSAR